MSNHFVENTKKSKGLPCWLNFVFALLGLILLFPIMMIVAALVKMTSRGPVFFKQKRLGKNGKEFYLYKFRTMRINSTGLKITSKNDERITVVGKLLRKAKFDEFPQLFNVLKGEMAIVGPRPEVKEYIDLHPEMWREILKVKPGITDPVTLKLRNEEELLSQAENPAKFYENYLAKYKAEGYLDYIKQRNWLYDIKIIFKTFIGVINPNLYPPPNINEIYEGWKNERK
ncbi:MAG: sugar transferase [Acidobacteria bacterium]|nr:sugar transferase [Acidobacteriota bacterium]